MAFDVKELMIDITKVGGQINCNPTACYASGGGCYASGGGCYASGGGCYASGGGGGCYASGGGGCYASCYNASCYAATGCHPLTVACFEHTVICRPTLHCLCTANCTYGVLTHCTPSILPCRFGTYTCLDTRITCGGTIYCAGTEDRTILYQGIERETLAEVKAQLNAALKEIEHLESRVAEEAKEGKKAK
jgi:hypothetical protein